MTTVPVRIGLVTTHQYCEKLKKLITKFEEEQKQFLTPDQFAKIVDLLNCVKAVLTDVPQYPTAP